MFIMRSVERQEDAIKAHHATRDVRQKLDEARTRVRELEEEVRRLKATKKTEKAVLRAARAWVTDFRRGWSFKGDIHSVHVKLQRAIERMEKDE
jgi:multidrug resistance efflux pump